MVLETASAWIAYLLLGGIMGALGQVVRSIAGLKKANDERPEGVAFSQIFDWPRFLISLVLGFTAGAIATLTMSAPDKLDAKFLLGLMAVGYGGTDFIEAFVRQYMPTGPAKPGVAKAQSPDPQALPPGAQALAAGPQTFSAPMIPSISIEKEVVTVIAREKNVDPKDIKLGEKLSDWQFDLADRRGLANAINIYFYDDLHMMFDTWLHPMDTEQDQTVAQVVQKVRSRHPRPRTDSAPPTS